METFSSWLVSEIEKRSWTQNELARRAGISHGTVSNILNGNKGVGENSLNAIAQALGIPPAVVFRRAGLLPKESPMTEQKERLLFLFDQLPESEQRSFLLMLAAMIDTLNR